MTGSVLGPLLEPVIVSVDYCSVASRSWPQLHVEQLPHWLNTCEANVTGDRTVPVTVPHLFMNNKYDSEVSV